MEFQSFKIIQDFKKDYFLFGLVYNCKNPKLVMNRLTQNTFWQTDEKTNHIQGVTKTVHLFI